MSSSEKGDELEHYVQGKLEVDHVEPEQPGQDGRQYSTSGRRLSQWDAM
jgi:hypothetical protein